MKSLLPVHLGVALLLVPHVGLAQADFEAYVEQIRESGMTEQAASAIRTAASIVSGASVLTAKPSSDGKSIGRSYTSALCFRPGVDDEKAKALREKIEAERQVWIDFFKKAADTDGSGFVSSKEGWELRERVELGILAPQIEQAENVDELVELLHQKRDQLVEGLTAYAQLRQGAAKEGLEGLPEIPEYLRGAIRTM